MKRDVTIGVLILLCIWFAYKLGTYEGYEEALWEEQEYVCNIEA